MLSFLREADKPDGKPGPLSMRRIAAMACFITAIATGVIAIFAIFRFIGINPNTTLDWKAFIPLFIPCIAFIVAGLLLLFFTTWADIKEVICAASNFKK